MIFGRMFPLRDRVGNNDFLFDHWFHHLFNQGTNTRPLPQDSVDPVAIEPPFRAQTVGWYRSVQWR